MKNENDVTQFSTAENVTSSSMGENIVTIFSTRENVAKNHFQ
jgi:hypothetical protein